MNIVKTACAGIMLASGALASAPAVAATYLFTFTPTSGAPVSASGELTTTGGANGVFGVDVTAITGFVGGSAITNLIPDPNAPNNATSADGLFIEDNNYDPATRSLDNSGLLFDVGSTEYNLFNNEDGTYYLYPGVRGSYATPSVGAFTASAVAVAVPEPAAWAMMLAGFGLAGGALRGARSKRAIAAA